MKSKKLPIFRWLLLSIFVFSGTFGLKAQTIDATGTFSPVLTGTEVVFAEMFFTDADSDGNYNAAFVLSQPPIAAWADYSAAIIFYKAGVNVRNGGANALSSPVVASVPGQVYQFWIALDVPGKKASYYVKTPADATPQLMYQNAAFRKTDITAIERWSAIHNPSGEPDYITVKYVDAVSAVGSYPVAYTSEAKLKSLTTSAGTLNPAFDPNVTNYDVLLPVGSTSVTVNASATSPVASVTGTGAVDVSSGSGTANIMVTSQDGLSSTTYTINFTVNVISDDATLQDLTVNGETVLNFSPSKLSYKVFLPVNVTGVPVVVGVKNNANADVVVTDAASLPGVTTVEVTAQDGVTKKIYTLNINESDNPMAGWDLLGATGDGSKPNDWLWENTTGSAIPWTNANGGGGCRMRDYNVTGGHTTFTYESDGSASTSRQFMFRWDASAYSTSFYTYPVYLQANTDYEFSFDYVCGGSATPPKKLKVGIDNTKLCDALIAEKEFETTNSTTLYRYGTFSFKTPDRTGYYYMTFRGDWAWFGVTNLHIRKLPTITATLNDEENGRLLFTSVGQTIDVPIVAEGFETNLGFETSEPGLFELSTLTLPSTGGTLSIRFIGTVAGDYSGSLTVGLNVGGFAPGLRKIKGVGTSLTIPMVATILTGVNNVENDQNRTYLSGNEIIAEFNLSKSSIVDMSVYNVNGMLIASNKQMLNAGANQMMMNANIANGVYFVKLNIAGEVTTTKLVK